MSDFSSPAAAYVWAYEVLLLWRSGSAFDPDPDLCIGRGSTGGMGTVITALSIMVIADRHDPGIKNQRPPIDRSKSWFDLEWVPRETPHYWRKWEEALLEKAKCGFCYDLWCRNLCRDGRCMVYGEGVEKRCGQG